MKPGTSSGYLFSRAGSSDESVRARLDRLDRDKLTGSAGWTARAEKYLADPEADAQRRRLAQELGVDVWSLAALSVGWKPGAYGVGAWTIPQRTAVGEIVSISLRIDREEQRQRFDSDGKTKSPSGLVFVPGRWLTASGPVLVVEGASDVAAVDSMRVDVVGHPGNSPGGRLLDELETILRAVPADREIVRIAERDPGREEDDDSPGRKGARATAQRLADRLGRRIGVALPPDAAKDSRGWLRERWLAGGSARRDELREQFVAGILGAVSWFEPQERSGEEDVPVEPLVEPAEEIELDEYRQRMRAAVEDWATDRRVRGRIAVLAAPAGSGKTTAVDELVLPHYGSFVNALPTHENCRERRDTLVRLPILEPDEVAAYPKLGDETCISFTRDQARELREQGHRGAVPAEDAQRLGFGVRATACRACPLAPWKDTGQGAAVDLDLDAFSPERALDVEEPDVEEPADPFGLIRCGYWREIARADAARGKLATLERIRRTGSRIVPKDDRALLVLDEEGFETLFPTATVGVDWLELLAGGLEGAALRIEAEAAAAAKPTKSRRRDARAADRRLLETDEDRRRRQETRDREARRLEREQRSAERRDDQIEHLRQLAAVADELARRLRDRAAGERWGVEIVPIERERRRGPRKKLTATEARRMDQALDEVVESWSSDAPAPTREPLIVRGRIVKQSARLLADALERSLPSDAVIDGTALDLVRRIHAGRVDCLALHVDPLDGDKAQRTLDGARRVKMAAIGTWETRLPDEADVLVLDGTLDVPALSKRLGREIEEIAPRARVRRQSFAAQLPADITKQTSPRTVARALERSLAALPDAKRVGIILLSDHRKKLFPRDRDGNDIRTKRSRELVPDHVLRRIARDADGRLLVEHYSGGKDRSSNQWIEQADALVLLGTPRPAGEAVVAELVRRRDVDALERGSAWGRKDWDGRTVEGALVRCRGRGYLDPAWAAAAAAVTRVGLLQALERARTLLAGSWDIGDRPGGIPVLVVSSEGGLGLPIVEELPEAVSRGARRVEDVVRRLLEGSGNVKPGKLGAPGSDPEGSPTCATTPTREIPLLVEVVAQVDREPTHGDPEGCGTVPGAPSRAVFDELVRTGLDGKGAADRTVRLWIAEALAAGLITKSGSTRATVYGLPCPVDIPDGLEEETTVAGPGTSEAREPDPVPDWELDGPGFGFRRDVPDPVVPGTGPPWSWTPTGPIEHVESRELLPTGPAAA